MKPTLLTLLALCLFASGLASADEYTHGNGALQIFDKQGMDNSPRWVIVWVMFMLATFATGLFFVWKHPIARWVVGGFILGFALSGPIANVLNVNPMLSGYIALVHIVFWSPGLYQLLTKRPFIGKRGAFAIWSGVITAVILFSFIFDFRDAFIFLKHSL